MQTVRIKDASPTGFAAGLKQQSPYRMQEAAQFPVKSEKSDDYEAGVRSEWFDRHLILNTTFYDTEYSNFQVQTIVPNLLNQFILTNIPKVRSRGLEK